MDNSSGDSKLVYRFGNKTADGGRMGGRCRSDHVGSHGLGVDGNGLRSLPGFPTGPIHDLLGAVVPSSARNARWRLRDRCADARQRLSQEFSRRVTDLPGVLSECAVIDQQGKGMLRGDAWLSLETLLVRLAGTHSVQLPSKHALLLRR